MNTLNVEELKKLLNEKKFVELGEEISKIKQEVGNLRRERRYKEATEIESKLKEFINKNFEEFKGKSEQFLELSPDERLKMAFILAAKSTVVEGMKTT